MYYIIILSCLAACGAQFVDEMQSIDKVCLGEDLFTCLDGDCILQDRFCDGTPDCADGSDENFCPDHRPDAHLCNVTHQYLCDDGLACVPATWVCNGVPDCTDASDEANCTVAPTNVNATDSTCKGFKCGDGKCISSLWTCDGIFDCDDRSDESIANCRNIPLMGAIIRVGKVFELRGRLAPVTCDDLGFEWHLHKCLHETRCIKRSQMCDNITDCRDGSDEGPFCDTWHTQCENTTCPTNLTTCVPDRTGPDCVCTSNPRYTTYNHTTKTCMDVDDCLLDRPSCSHRCRNFHGYFVCYCDKGYVTDPLGYLCFASGPEAMLFFSTANEIRYITLATKQNFTVATGIKKSHGVSYDGKYLYWVEKAEGHQAIARAHLENPIETKETLVSLGLYEPGDIAVDHLGGNIYFTDQERGVIHVCKSDGSICTRVHENSNPRFVTLDVKNGTMYWADSINGSQVIMRSRMDGSNVEEMLGGIKNFAIGLAFDVHNDRLYYIDEIIWVLHVITKRVYPLFEQRYHHPSALAVFENTVYWSDWVSNTIQTTDKLHPIEFKHNTVLAKLDTIVYGLHVYHPVLMERDPNPCAGHNCSHLCLLSSNITYTCACPIGMVLKGSTCHSEENYHPEYLIVGAGASFTRFQYDALGNPESHATTFDIGRVHAMAYDSRRDILYVYDGMRKEINTIGMTDFSLGITRVFAYNGLEDVVDMDYDYMTDNLYVLDAGRRFLEVFSAKDGKRALLHRFPDQETPLSFCIVQSIGKILVAVIESEQNNEIHIDSLSLDGDGREHQHVILNGLKGPRVRIRSLHNSDLVAISDETSNSIDFINVKLIGFKKSIRKILPTAVTSLAVTLPLVFWTDRKSSRVFWAEYHNILQHDTPRRMELSIFPNNTHLHIQATSRAPNDTIIAAHPCSQNPCSHICVQSHQPGQNRMARSPEYVDPSKYSYKCLCPPGLIVEGGRCNKLAACGQDELYCYESNVCIPRAKRCDGTNDCVHGEDEKDCSGNPPRPTTSCLPTQIECNGTCIHATEQCPTENTANINPPFSCGSEQFQCVTNKLCLDREQVCDQHPDCPDGSDEGSLCHTLRCLETEFMCTSRNCILSSFRCDGDADCNDGSDEEGCENRNCGVGSYQCRSGQCVDLHRRCDTQPDCFDGSDEQNCEELDDTVITASCLEDEMPCELNKSICVPQTSRCNAVIDCPGGTDEHDCHTLCTVRGHFECKQEQRCISIKRVCNQNKDCTDGSDEFPEECEKVNRTSGVFQQQFQPPYPPAECRHGFLCRTGQCIEWPAVCDQTPDCFDNSDENGQCFTACENSTCTHHCQATPHGPQCTCNPGFDLLPDLHTCRDTDECLKEPCSQICMNFPGSFLCSCRHGYALRSDRRSCKASIAATKSILFASAGSVRSISDLGVGRVEFNDPTVGIIADIDVNVATNKLYVSSPQTGTLIEVTSLEERNHYNDTERNVISNIGRPTKLAVEWVTGNVYFVDNSLVPSIKVCNFQTKRCAVVKKLPTGSVITSLAVSPETHHLYYCSENASPGIPLSRLDLSGLNQNSLEIDDECIGLAGDGPVLYMAGRKDLWSLDSERLYGKKSMTTWPMLYPHAIVIFEDHVYILGNHRIYACLTFGPKNCLPYIFRLPDAQAFVIRHPSTQRRDLKNSCDGYTCDNVCVLGENGPKCVCEDGRISDDGKCTLLAQSEVPLFNGVAAQDYQLAHQTTATLISVTLVLFVVYLAIFIYYHLVYRPRKEAATLPVRFQNQTSFDGTAAHSSGLDMPIASGSRHEYINPLQYVRNIWQTSFASDRRPIGTAGLSIDVPPPKEDLSDTESDIDYKDERTLITT